MTIIAFDPGTYWIGDLCYVISEDTWQNKICPAFENEGSVDTVLVAIPNGIAFLGNTEYGDGTYNGSNGFKYSVDSGTIGIVHKAAMKEELDSSVLSGTFITRDKHFNADIHEGHFKFDDIIIETDDDDTCDECGDPDCRGDCCDECDDDCDCDCCNCD